MTWLASLQVEGVPSLLEKAKAEDIDPRLGRLFAYVYEAGDENIRKVAQKALLEYAEKNLLDFAVFRGAICHGLKELGFESLGKVESSILALYNKDVDLIGFVSNIKKLGWYVSLQRGLKEHGISDDIHLVISSLHADVADTFSSDAKKALEKPELSAERLYAMIERGAFDELVKRLQEGVIDSSVIPKVLEATSEEMAIELIKNIVVGWFK